MTGPQIVVGLIVAFNAGLYAPAVWSWWRRRRASRRFVESVRILDYVPPQSFPRCLPGDPSPKPKRRAS